MADAGSSQDSVDVAAIDPAEEFAHPLSDPDDPHAVATFSYGFSVGERDLHCTIHHSLHPALGLTSGGVILNRGVLQNLAFADYIDYRGPMPSGEPDDAGHPSGVRVAVVEPLRRIDLSYAGRDGRVRFELTQEALTPAVRPPESGRFAQAMHTTGELVLDGERIAIDGYFTRHRSWSTSRPRSDDSKPPLGLASVVFGPDLAVHFSARDGTGLSSESLDWGYVWRGGEARPLEAIWMRTGRDVDGAAPTGVEARLLDAEGESYELTGETRARAPFSVRPEVIDQRCLVRYRMHGREGYGEFQDTQHNGFLRSIRSPPARGR